MLELRPVEHHGGPRLRGPRHEAPQLRHAAPLRHRRLQRRGVRLLPRQEGPQRSVLSRYSSGLLYCLNWVKKWSTFVLLLLIICADWGYINLLTPLINQILIYSSIIVRGRSRSLVARLLGCYPPTSRSPLYPFIDFHATGYYSDCTALCCCYVQFPVDIECKP